MNKTISAEQADSAGDVVPSSQVDLNDQAGMGGSYEMDAKTGYRRLLARTQIDDAGRLRRMPETTATPVDSQE